MIPPEWKRNPDKAYDEKDMTDEEDAFYNADYHHELSLTHIAFELNIDDITYNLIKIDTAYSQYQYIISKIEKHSINSYLTYYKKNRNDEMEYNYFWEGMLDARGLNDKTENLKEVNKSFTPEQSKDKEKRLIAYQAGLKQWKIFAKLNEWLNITRQGRLLNKELDEANNQVPNKFKPFNNTSLELFEEIKRAFDDENTSFAKEAITAYFENKQFNSNETIKVSGPIKGKLSSILGRIWKDNQGKVISYDYLIYCRNKFSIFNGEEINKDCPTESNMYKKFMITF